MASRKRTRDAVTLFLAVLALYAAVFGARAWWLAAMRSVRLTSGKPAYYHYELVDVFLRARDPKLAARWQARPPRVAVLREGKPVTTIAGVVAIPLRYDADAGAWVGRWPCPWNAPEGPYELALLGESDLGDRLQVSGFKIKRRKPWPLPRGFSVVTLESVMPLSKMEVVAPDGTKKDWRGLLDWVQYVGADAFWMLGGQTPGEKPGEVWVDNNLSMIPIVARECHRRGLKFGVYAECYLTMSDKEKVGGYEYARDVKDGHSFVTRAISLRDPKRPRDVAALLKKFRDIKGVDFVGLDYVRNALGGYELADEFFDDMPGVPPPPEWSKLTEDERMVWFARKKIMRRDLAFIDAWQWWRAHKVGEIVRQIKDELGDEKPLWAFTLTWDKGWHHGQDPVMMNDAGIDLDALMLYQADKDQFAALVNDWHRYAHHKDVQLVVGDIIDWPLHQRDPSGPLELYRRETTAIDRIYADGPASGVFFHDLARALWGHTGPWGTRGWMGQARRVVSYLKSK